MIYNFNAGPGTLPQNVLTDGAAAVRDFDNGLSILEISHRSPKFDDVLNELNTLTVELLGIDEQKYSVLWLHGGASMQFAMIPYNFLKACSTASYLDTGIWANKAIKEANKIGKVAIAGTSAADNYKFIPSYRIDKEAAYFHYTSNNTIYGTQLKDVPKTDVPVVCDMSSDILSRPVDVNKYSLIYAGAQKNVGTAGVCLVIIDKAFAETANANLLSMWDYRQHIAANSRYNTPPVYAMYIALLNLRWLKGQGGVTEIMDFNVRKALALYAEIDRNSLFTGTADKQSRSDMNVCFTARDAYADTIFNKVCFDAGIRNITGHRTVGGYRASIYNAMPEQGVKTLIEAMQRTENLV